MRGNRGRVSRRTALGLTALTVVGLVMGTPARSEAEESPTWEAIEPVEEPVQRLFTPTSGALFARTKQSLYRSDDGGLTWTEVSRPPAYTVVSVSPVDQQRLYAAGGDGVYRSEDGGGHWERISDQGGEWIQLEVSPADPSVMYGVAITRPPSSGGTNRWTEFRVSHDAGATWETVRTHHETVYAGTQPCAYGVRLVQPHSLSSVRVLTIEGCTGRAMEPVGGMSPDAWETMQQVPAGPVSNWGASAIDGGRGLRPERWYAAVYFPGEAYSRIKRSQILRSDDDGATWTTVYEADGGDPDHGKGVPIDSVQHLAYDPLHPDEVYAAFSHFDLRGTQHAFTGLTVKRSRDGGVTWTDLGTERLPADQWGIRLTVGIDSRYLYATSGSGAYRLTLDR